MNFSNLAPSKLLHNLSPPGLFVAVFIMVFFSISAPTFYLYSLAVEQAVSKTDGAHLLHIRQAGITILSVAIMLSVVLAHFAKRLREKSLALLEQMREAEEKLRAQINVAEQANQSKSELLAIATHDLKNPLSAIVGMSDILLDTKRAAADQEAVSEDIEVLETINSSAGLMFEIVRGILANEGLQLGWTNSEKKPVNLAELCRETLKLNTPQATKKNITLHENILEDLTVTGDGTLLREALDNYVSNAIKYSDQNKNVTVTLQRSDDGKDAVLTVQDEGPGLSEKDQQKLFSKFKKLSARPTSDEFSTGLGLSIVKTVVERHHGKVGCQSKLGSGCLFWIKLPLN